MITDEQLTVLTAEQRADLAHRLAALAPAMPDPAAGRGGGRGADPGPGARAGLGIGPGLGTGAGLGAGPGLGAGAGPGTGAGLGAGRDAGAGRVRRIGRWFAVAVLAGCALLVGWIGTLTLTLPHRYLTENWDTAWIGFDTLLLASLAATAWTAWRASPALRTAAFTTAVLLVCDAWFDVMTASTTGDLTVSLIAALAVELPAAAALLHVSRGLTAQS